MKTYATMIGKRGQYVKAECTPIEMETSILANSVLDETTVASTGQKVGKEIDFENEGFNFNWETGYEE